MELEYKERIKMEKQISRKLGERSNTLMKKSSNNQGNIKLPIL